MKKRGIEFSLKFGIKYAMKISLIIVFFSQILLSKFENRLATGRQMATPLTGNDLAACRFSEVNFSPPLRNRRPFSFPTAVLSMRQTPAFFDVAIVSAFYVSRSQVGHRSLFFDELPLDTRIRADVFPIEDYVYTARRKSLVFRVASAIFIDVI